MMPNSFIKSLYSKGTVNRIVKKIKLLGVNCSIDINKYLLIKFILLVIVFFGSLFTLNFSYFISPLITIGIYILYDYIFLDLKIKKRSKTLEKDAIFFFEVLSLTLQSENNLKICLENSCDAIDSDISDEFKEVLKEVRIGKSLTESLIDAKERIPSENVNNILLNIIESYIYGTSINDALENQIEYLTDKRIMEIKERINKMPTKISIASVLFFIPIVMILILGPILINYIIK